MHMSPEHYVLSLTKEECAELYRGCLARAMVEDELRREKGLEPVSERPVLGRIERLLRTNSTEMQRITEETDDELWEYAWYAVTDEWAWFRALQEEREALGKDFETMSGQNLRERVERRYQRDFERYIREIEMKDIRPATSRNPRAKNA